MGLKAGLKPLTQKQKNHRKSHLQTIHDFLLADCDSKKNNIFYKMDKTNDIQKFMIEIGAVFGDNYITDDNVKEFLDNSNEVIERIFSLIPKDFCEKEFVKENINFLKNGVSIGCRRKVAKLANISDDNTSVDVNDLCDNILTFMETNSTELMNIVNDKNVQTLIELGRYFKNQKMKLNSNIYNMWILIGYYDSLYSTLNNNILSEDENNERKVR